MSEVYAVAINPTIFPPAQTFPTFASIINVLIPNLTIIAGIILFIIFIMVGFRFLSKAGKVETEELKKIMSLLGAALIGFIIIIASYWIVIIIEKLTGVSIINPGDNF